MADNTVEALKDYPVRLSHPVRWGELDALNHVNNSVYFRYFEDVRIRLMEEPVLAEIMQREGNGLVLVRIEGNFRREVTYPDHLVTGIRVRHIGNTSFSVEHAVHSRKAGSIVCIGEGVGVLLDRGTGVKKPISDALRRALETYR